MKFYYFFFLRIILALKDFLIYIIWCESIFERSKLKTIKVRLYSSKWDKTALLHGFRHFFFFFLMKSQQFGISIILYYNYDLASPNLFFQSGCICFINSRIKRCYQAFLLNGSHIRCCLKFTRQHERSDLQYKHELIVRNKLLLADNFIFCRGKVEKNFYCPTCSSLYLNMAWFRRSRFYSRLSAMHTEVARCCEKNFSLAQRDRIV